MKKLRWLVLERECGFFWKETYEQYVLQYFDEDKKEWRELPSKRVKIIKDDFSEITKD